MLLLLLLLLLLLMMMMMMMMMMMVMLACVPVHRENRSYGENRIVDSGDRRERSETTIDCR